MTSKQNDQPWYGCHSVVLVRFPWVGSWQLHRPTHLKSRSRVLLVDDYVLAAHADLRIVGEARDAKPDIILMDYNMPMMNGIDAARLIEKPWGETVIIGLCTVQDSYITDRFLKAGASAVIVKDQLDHLHSTIQRAFPKRASSDRLVAQH